MVKGVKEYELSVGQYGDIYYFCPDVATSEYSLRIEEDTVDMSNWEHTLYSYQKTGKDAYYITGNFATKSPELYIYYPAELLPAKPDDVTGYRMGVSYFDTKYDKNKYERPEGIVIEDYQVYEISLKNREDISFRLLFETKL